MSTAIPVVAGWAAGNVGSGLIATLGAFTSRFGGDRPYGNRAQQLAVVAVAVRCAAAPIDLEAETAVPDVLRAEVTALCEALRPSHEP